MSALDRYVRLLLHVRHVAAWFSGSAGRRQSRLLDNYSSASWSLLYDRLSTGRGVDAICWPPLPTPPEWPTRPVAGEHVTGSPRRRRRWPAGVRPLAGSRRRLRRSCPQLTCSVQPSFNYAEYSQLSLTTYRFIRFSFTSTRAKRRIYIFVSCIVFKNNEWVPVKFCEGVGMGGEKKCNLILLTNRILHHEDIAAVLPIRQEAA